MRAHELLAEGSLTGRIMLVMGWPAFKQVHAKEDEDDMEIYN